MSDTDDTSWSRYHPGDLSRYLNRLNHPVADQAIAEIIRLRRALQEIADMDDLTLSDVPRKPVMCARAALGLDDE